MEQLSVPMSSTTAASGSQHELWTVCSASSAGDVRTEDQATTRWGLVGSVTMKDEAGLGSGTEGWGSEEASSGHGDCQNREHPSDLLHQHPALATEQQPDMVQLYPALATEQQPDMVQLYPALATEQQPDMLHLYPALLQASDQASILTQHLRMSQGEKTVICRDTGCDAEGDRKQRRTRSRRSVRKQNEAATLEHRSSPQHGHKEDNLIDLPVHFTDRADNSDSRSDETVPRKRSRQSGKGNHQSAAEEEKPHSADKPGCRKRRPPLQQCSAGTTRYRTRRQKPPLPLEKTSTCTQQGIKQPASQQASAQAKRKRATKQEQQLSSEHALGQARKQRSSSVRAPSDQGLQGDWKTSMAESMVDVGKDLNVKRRHSTSKARMAENMVNIGGEVLEHWKEVGLQRGLATDAEIAGFLLKHFRATDSCRPCPSCQRPLRLLCPHCPPPSSPPPQPPSLSPTLTTPVVSQPPFAVVCHPLESSLSPSSPLLPPVILGVFVKTEEEEQEDREEEQEEPLTAASEEAVRQPLRRGRKRKGPQSHLCSECGATFKRAGALKVHIRKHTGEKPFSCSECEQSFSTSGQLVNHGRKHSGDRPYVCSVCDASFPVASSLKQHSCIHTGHRPYACHVCEQLFRYRGDLTAHVRKHTGDKPFLCSDCGKSFAMSSHLSKHRRIHSGYRPFECPTCHKTFPFRNRLTLHMRTHTGEKPFLCADCGSSFIRASTLTIHRRIYHTFEKPCICPFCGHAFADSANLSKHKKNKHGAKASSTPLPLPPNQLADSGSGVPENNHGGQNEEQSRSLNAALMSGMSETSSYDGENAGRLNTAHVSSTAQLSAKPASPELPFTEQAATCSVLSSGHMATLNTADTGSQLLHGKSLNHTQNLSGDVDSGQMTDQRCSSTLPFTESQPWDMRNLVQVGSAAQLDSQAYSSGAGSQEHSSRVGQLIQEELKAVRNQNTSAVASPQSPSIETSTVSGDGEDRVLTVKSVSTSGHGSTGHGGEEGNNKDGALMSSASTGQHSLQELKPAGSWKYPFSV